MESLVMYFKNVELNWDMVLNLIQHFSYTDYQRGRMVGRHW